MKKHLLTAVTALAGLGLLLGAALAEDEEGQEGQEGVRRARREGREGRPARVQRRAAWQRVLAELDLSEEKRGAVENVVKTHTQAVENWQKEHAGKFRELREKLQAARRENDQDKVTAVQADMRKLWDARRALQDNLTKQLAEHLTAEQMEKVKAAMAGGPRAAQGPLPAAARLNVLLRNLRRVNLDEKQSAQVKVIVARADAAMAKAAKDIDALLTAEQKQRLEQMRTRVREGRERRVGDRERRVRARRRGEGEQAEPPGE
jgi:Spy/CpxP family protein refolding chaperone